MSRTIADVQREYQQAALELGAETYKQFALNEELDSTDIKVDQLKKKMLHLNKEANKLSQKESLTASTEAEVVSNEQPQS